MAYTSFYDDLDYLSEVDWPMIASTYWADTQADGDRKRRKQAEFLVHQQFPWNQVLAIAVRSETRRQEVESMLAHSAVKPKVSVKPDWYY